MTIKDTFTPVLQQAQAVQDEARDLFTKKVRGEPLSEDQVCAWMDERRKLAAAEVCSSVDALAVAHGMLQCIEALHRFADDAETLNYVAGEIALAAYGLVRFLENSAGVTRETLGLFDDYVGPSRH